MTDAPSCDAHRALVALATGPDPADEVLERYATEAAECPACRRAVAAQLGVHPVVLDRAARGPGLEEPPGMRALRDALDARPAAFPWRRVAIAAAAAAALIAGITWATWPPRPAEVAPAVAIAPPAPQPAPTASPMAPAEPEVPPAAPQVARREPPRQALPVPPAPEPDQDAVALAPELGDDWPPPPFEDLRGDRPKAADGPIRAVQLVLSGGRRVGERADLTVVASAESSLAVCVSGPERGVVWRGAVPAGRTDLSRQGRPQSFVFAAPGTYRFAISTSDMDRCSDPVHVVEVEVGG